MNPATDSASQQAHDGLHQTMAAAPNSQALPGTELAPPDTQHALQDTQHALPDAQYAPPEPRHALQDTQHAPADTWHALPDTQSTSRDTQEVLPETQHVLPVTQEVSSEAQPDLSEIRARRESNGSVTTLVAPNIQPDYDIDDEGYAESTGSTYLTSIASEVSKGILENERIYPQYGKHSYGMPVDEDEMDRMDLQHRKYELVLGGRHFLAPFRLNPDRILDLGTGTGIWALDVADMFPSAQVIGVDIAPIQPKWVASNCQFEIDDIEEPWTWKKNSFDFIHLRDPLYMIRDWSTLMQQIYDHLAPGGYCELASIYPLPMCDDGTMPEDSGFLQVCKKFIEASKLFGTPADVAPLFKDMMRKAGFSDVSENIYKVPASPWPKDKYMKKIGALEMANVVQGATAFGMRGFTQAFGWTRDEVELALMNFRRDVKNRNYHQYCQYIVTYGRKPHTA